MDNGQRLIEALHEVSDELLVCKRAFISLHAARSPTRARFVKRVGELHDQLEIIIDALQEATDTDGGLHGTVQFPLLDPEQEGAYGDLPSALDDQ